MFILRKMYHLELVVFYFMKGLYIYVIFGIPFLIQ